MFSSFCSFDGQMTFMLIDEKRLRSVKEPFPESKANGPGLRGISFRPLDNSMLPASKICSCLQINIYSG